MVQLASLLFHESVKQAKQSVTDYLNDHFDLFLLSNVIIASSSTAPDS